MAIPFLAIAPLISKFIDRIIPDKEAAAAAKVKLVELEQSGDIADLNAETEILLAQIGVNREEAKSGNWLVAGWRPAVGWVCVVGIAWNFVIYPLVTWIGAFANPVIKVPSLEIGQLMVLLLGMLGIGGMRSLDKVNKVDTARLN